MRARAAWTFILAAVTISAGVLAAGHSPARMIRVIPVAAAPAAAPVTPLPPTSSSTLPHARARATVHHRPSQADIDLLERAKVVIAYAAAHAHTRPAPPVSPIRIGTAITVSQPPGAGPAPVSSRRCPAGPVQAEIDAVFGSAAPWAESVAWRESNCEAGARNGRSGSAGVFQLLGHDDLLRAACPTVDPGASWAIADCNIRAAKDLYDVAGIGPWHL